MSFILGIDTGGTYTDGVIVKAGTDEIVCKAKALTTKENLSLGIKNCLEALDFNEKEKISLVSLSTTLATNAIVEGRGGTVGLIYLGQEIDEEVPTEIKYKVKGKCHIMGRIEEDIDEDEIVNILGEMKDKVSAIAVSAYASVRNSRHEKLIEHIIKRELNIPVVCAHQLTSALGFHHRTVTAVLNARLIPIINNLLISIKETIEVMGIKAPIMIVRGDGTLMTEKMALEKPIDTIMSGPAASIIGGTRLTGLKDAIVLDMGGTTTDLANIREGRVVIKKEGAKVGRWRTRVQAADISTFGLGGDSRIRLGPNGEIKIGPEKAWPLCVMGSKYPNLANELQSFKRYGEFKHYSEQEAEAYIYVKDPDSTFEELENWEIKILKLLKEAPHSATFLSKAIGIDPETLNLNKLVEHGSLGRVAFTPTDLLHVKGTYTAWDRDISNEGAKILAKRLELPLYKFIEKLTAKIDGEMAYTCLQSATDFSDVELEYKNSKEAMYIIENAFLNGADKLLKPGFELTKDIVAIGAPAEAWAPRLSQLLKTNVIIPENADVANAFGAAVGQVAEKLEIELILDGNKFVVCFPWGQKVYPTREEAMFYAIHEGRKHIEHILRKAGFDRAEIKEELQDVMVELKENEPKVNMGSKLKLFGVGISNMNQ